MPSCCTVDSEESEAYSEDIERNEDEEFASGPGRVAATAAAAVCCASRPW
jgi:hypothetical protein